VHTRPEPDSLCPLVSPQKSRPSPARRHRHPTMTTLTRPDRCRPQKLDLVDPAHGAADSCWAHSAFSFWAFFSMFPFFFCYQSCIDVFYLLGINQSEYRVRLRSLLSCAVPRCTFLRLASPPFPFHISSMVYALPLGRTLQHSP